MEVTSHSRWKTLYSIVLIVYNTVYFKVVKRVNLMFFTTICFLMNEFWLHKTMLKVYVCNFVLHHSSLQIFSRLCQSDLWLPAANQFEDFNKKQKLLEACLSQSLDRIAGDQAWNEPKDPRVKTIGGQCRPHDTVMGTFFLPFHPLP